MQQHVVIIGGISYQACGSVTCTDDEKEAVQRIALRP